MLGANLNINMTDIFQKVSPATGKPSTDMTNIHKEITIDNRIFLKGLRPDTKEEDLENIFKTYGAIVETKIIRDNFDGRSKGYGFITFDSQQVTQDILRDVQSIQTDDMEITIAPAKIKRLPPQGKSFRNRHVPFSHQLTPQQNFIPDNNPMVSQYYSMPMPCVVSPDGLFTWYPNIPTYQKAYPEIIYPDANIDPNMAPILSPPQSPPVSSKVSNENKTNNSNYVESNNANDIYSQVKPNNFQPLQPLPSTPNSNQQPQQLTEISPAIINNQNVENQQKEFNKFNNVPSNNNAGVLQNIIPTSAEIVHLNNGYLYPQNAFLPQNTSYVNAYPHHQPSVTVNSNNKLKPSPIFFKGVPLYDNAPTPPSTPTGPNNPMEINVITSDMKNMVVQPSFQRIHIPAPNAVNLKAENINFNESSPAPVKPLGNSHQTYPTQPKVATEVDGQQNGDSKPLETQNFVFMPTAPGKVNRVVVH